MSLPTTRQEFKDNCLRRLGYPVVEVNVTEEQIDDRVDEALQYYWDYHFDGADKIYYKSQITANNRNDRVYDLTVANGGISYSNSDTLVFTGGHGNLPGTVNTAIGTITTDANGTIISADLSSYGDKYAEAPIVTISTSTGSGASITARLGGFIAMPENVIGAVKIFDISSAYHVGNIFSIQYQIVLNDLYNLTSVSMVPYYMTFQHLRLMEQLLVGQQPIRYNRHQNKLYVDTDWSRFVDDNFLVVEAYQIVDPDEFADVWKDRWLTQYCTALIKRQWGLNTKKYGNQPLPGGMFFNGQIIYDEAVNEIKDLEHEMITTYSLPVLDMIGTFAPLLINTGIGLFLLECLNAWNSLPLA